MSELIVQLQEKEKKWGLKRSFTNTQLTPEPGMARWRNLRTQSPGFIYGPGAHTASSASLRHELHPSPVAP